MTDTTVTDPIASQGPYIMDKGPPQALAGNNPALAMADKIQGLQGQDDAAFAAEQKALKGPRSALSHSLNTPPPAPPTQQQLGPAPDQQDYQKDAMAWASAMAVLGAVAGKFARVPGTAALSAFGGALKGWQEGNLQAYEGAAKKWEQDSKAAIDNNKMVMDKYKLELENRKNNIDQQMANIQMIAAQYHDKMMYDASAAKNYTLVAGIYEKNAQFTEKASEARDKLVEKRQEQQQKAEQSATYWLSPDGQARMELPAGQPGALSEQQKAGVKQMIELYAKKQGGAQPRSATAMSLRQFIDERTAAGNPPTSEEIQNFQAKQTQKNAYARTAAGMAARVENATNEVQALIPQAIETSEKVLRGQVVPLNKVNLALKRQISDTELNDWELANFSLINAYTRAMNPQGVPRVNDRLEQHAMGILSTATSQAAYMTQLKRLWKEVTVSKAATKKTLEGPEGDDAMADPFEGYGAGGAAEGGWGPAEVVK
jgi:hypothetical protein